MRRLLPAFFGISLVLMAQTILQQNYDVRTYAKGSKTGGVQEAINAAAAAGGGTVQLPAGTVTAGTITLPNNTPIHLRGAGIGATTLILATGTNADLITNADFATLTNTNTYPAGIYRVTISDLTIDGNKANQSGTSWPIRIYGHGNTLRDIVIQNGRSGGLYTEYAVDPPFTSTATDLENFYENVRIIFNGGTGYLNRGPHDSYASKLTIYQNAGWGIDIQVGANYSGAGLYVLGMDTYLNTSGGCRTAGAFLGSGIACTSATGPGLEIVSNAGSVELSASTFGTGDGSPGILATGNNHNISGYASNVGNVAGGYALTLNGVQQSQFNLQLVCGTPGCINAASDSGHNIIRGTAQSSAGCLIGAGSPSVWSTYDLANIYSNGCLPQWFRREPGVATWNKYHVVKIANGVNGCASANGCWRVNSQTPVTATAGTSQTLTLDSMPANGFIAAGLLKSTVAVTGVTTATINAGNTGGTAIYFAGNYDLMAAVSATNFAAYTTTGAGNTLGGQSLSVTFTTTGGNVSDIATGAAFDVSIQWGVIQ